VVTRFQVLMATSVNVTSSMLLGRVVSSKLTGVSPIRLHSVISQKGVIIVAAERTWNLTKFKYVCICIYIYTETNTEEGI
jgi:hypothetical protein